ncbi:MAG: RES family NAD+ phosphorylase [Bacteroidetes bacterium]|nr:RES family NAD+ phosphorylase [Bacteroidota bacterium]
MIIYRLANTKFKDDLHGEGAKLFGGRWNSPGEAMLYATEHISLAVLEILVNKRTSDLHKASFSLLELSIPDKEIQTLLAKDLKKNWVEDIEYTQYIGDHFLQDEKVWILKVPSAVIEEEHNFIINPNHKGYKKLSILHEKVYSIDHRLGIL